MEDDYDARLRDFDAILVPGGFGKRGVEADRAISYARARARLFRHLPRHADCVRELRANAGELRDADSTEFNVDTPHPIIFSCVIWLTLNNWAGQCASSLAVPLVRGLAGARSLWRRGRDQRAPSPSLRVQPGVS